LNIDPVSSAAPNVHPSAKVAVANQLEKSSVALMCLAQGHPLPHFR
jgi:hypothetical protein